MPGSEFAHRAFERRSAHGRAAARAVLCLTALPLAALAAVDAGAARPVVHPADWPAVRSGVPADPGVEAFVDGLLRSMTLEEKVGQVIQADIGSITPRDLASFRLGSILAGGNAAPEGDVRATAARWRALVDEFVRASVQDPPPNHPPIPILFGIDAVHGHARIRGATIFPHNVGLGAAHDPQLIEQIGRATAGEIAATGMHWTFAPTLAVARDLRWGRSYESCSEDPALVALYADAMINGLQGRAGTAGFLAPGRTLATAKHFLGDGGTLRGRDQFDNLTDERTLRRVHGAGYPPAIAAGALVVMASYNSWHGTKMHARRDLLEGVLKGRWSFPGFVIGDWNAQEEVPGCTKYSCPEIFEAGIDMYMAPDSWKRLYANLLEQVRSGRLAPARLDDAVRRILRVKKLAGLFEPEASRAARPPDPAAGPGSAAHRALARSAVRESLVLLKNDRNVLPLDPRSRILVVGAGADDIAMQSGGWSVDWQGDHNTNADFPGATSILAGIRAAVESAGGSATLSVDGSFTERPDAAIAVFGESPYAEYHGDRETLDFGEGAKSPELALLQRLRALGIPVISVFLSGRPLWINPELNASNAFVAAWLPGSEGAGVADLLFAAQGGARAFDFTGRLAFSWPATAMPVRFDGADRVRGALFARGYGLSLRDRRTVGRVGEQRAVPRELRAAGTLFHAGHVTAPWSAVVGDPGGAVRLTMASQPSPQALLHADLTPSGLRLAWNGARKATFSVGGRGRDYRALAATDAAVVLRYRVEQPPAARVFVGIGCEAPYGPPTDASKRVRWGLCGTRDGALLDATARFAANRPRGWQQMKIPFACLGRLGADLARVDVPFTMVSSGAFVLHVAELRFEGATGAAADCTGFVQGGIGP
jgi:beta-glucosidase